MAKKNIKKSKNIKPSVSGKLKGKTGNKAVAPTKKKWFQFKIIPFIFLAVVVFITFSPVLENDFISLDDEIFIVNNEMIKSLDKDHIQDIFSRLIYSPFYKPLVYLSWALEFNFWGLNPGVFHFNNLLLHFINICLLFQILLLLFRKIRPKSKTNIIAAVVISLLWAIHPLRVESVAWAVERKDVLFSFLFFSSILCYSYYINRKKYFYIVIGAVLFGLGLLSKSMIIVLPGVLFIFDYLYKRKNIAKLIIEKIPYLLVFIIGLVLYGIIENFQDYSAGITLGVLEDPGLTEQKDDFIFFSNNALLSKIIFISFRLMSWFWRIFFPENLSVLYPVPEFLNQTGINAGLFIYPVMVLLLLAIMIFTYRKNRIITAGIAFFFITILPVLGMKGHETSLINDRYTYLASLGIILIIGVLLFDLIIKKPKLKIPVYMFFIIVTIVFAVSTNKQVKTWKNSYVLWNSVVEKYPDLSYGYFYRGNIKFRAERYQDALQDYNTAIGLEDHRAEFYRNRGSAKDFLKDFDGAIADFTRAIKVFPDYAAAYHDRAGARVKMSNRDVEGAIKDCDTALIIEKRYAAAYYRRGLLKSMRSDQKGAIEDFNLYIERVTTNGRAYLNRGIAEQKLELIEEACRDFGIAHQLGVTQAKGMIDRYCGE